MFCTELFYTIVPTLFPYFKPPPPSQMLGYEASSIVGYTWLNTINNVVAKLKWVHRH